MTGLLLSPGHKGGQPVSLSICWLFSSTKATRSVGVRMHGNTKGIHSHVEVLRLHDYVANIAFKDVQKDTEQDTRPYTLAEFICKKARTKTLTFTFV